MHVLPVFAVDRVSEVLEAHVGLRRDPALLNRLRRCLRDAAACSGLTVEDHALAISTDAALLQDLLDRVTVQETAFFRHPEHFQVLVERVLPALTGPVNIWSAGCANGQEAYSLAMVLDEQGRDGTVLATDVSGSALARTASGAYTSAEMTGVGPARRSRHFDQRTEGWTVRPHLRERVDVQRHNLLGPHPRDLADVQVVFCRNVLIYLSEGHVVRFLDRLADSLSDGAFLFLGSAESIWHVSDRFETVHLEGTFVHRRRSPVRKAQRARGAQLAAPPTAGASGANRLNRPGRVAPALPPARAHGPVARPVPHAPVARPSEAGDAGEGALAAARAGQDALQAGDPAAAIAAFRRWVYLAPDDVDARFHLAHALEVSGDTAAAARAYGTAGALLDKDQLAGSRLGGYRVDALRRLLDAKAEGKR
jgi:chemotaxis protein methyltransferase CheR